ncbi:MAG: hypothetical protein JNJ97_12275 [Alphaproteobacteria bacterium]|nr:hypothetical protein [Alphaproteobacteria bacterium]
MDLPRADNHVDARVHARLVGEPQIVGTLRSATEKFGGGGAAGVVRGEFAHIAAYAVRRRRIRQRRGFFEACGVWTPRLDDRCDVVDGTRRRAEALRLKYGRCPARLI